MQTILPYSRESAAMPVVCSCQSCRCYGYLQYPQRKVSTAHPPERLETSKSLPNLLPPSIPLTCGLRRVRPPDQQDERDDIHQDAVLQQPLSSLGNEQTPWAGRSRTNIYHRVTRVAYTAHCAVRTQPSRLRLVFRAPAHARGGRRWSEGAKAEKKSQITRLSLSSLSALVLSLFFILFPFRRISMYVRRQYFFCNWVCIYNIYILRDYRNTRIVFPSS